MFFYRYLKLERHRNVRYNHFDYLTDKLTNIHFVYPPDNFIGMAFSFLL